MDVPGQASGSLGGIAKKRPAPEGRTEADAQTLREVLAGIEAAAGTYVRCERRALIIGRPEALGPRGQLEDDDRLKLTPLGAGCYGVWAALANGRYEFTEIAEAIGDMGPHLEGALLHYIREWTSPPKPKKPRRKTSGM